MQGTDKFNFNEIDTIYYHGNCPDGIVAAGVLQPSMTEKKFIPYFFEVLKEVPSRALFIDCSPKPEMVIDALNNGCCIAEHHDGFRPFLEDIEYYPNQIMFGENSKQESGATLALTLLKNELYSRAENPMSGLAIELHIRSLKQVTDLISISDTWTKTDPEKFNQGRALAAWITLQGKFPCKGVLEDGKTIDWELINTYWAGLQSEYHRIAKRATIGNSRDIRYALINTDRISDIADILREKEGCDIICAYHIYADKDDPAEMKVGLSFRGNDRFPALGIAQAFGGGGHVHAAGATIPFDNNFMDKILDKILV